MNPTHLPFLLIPLLLAAPALRAQDAASDYMDQIHEVTAKQLEEQLRQDSIDDAEAAGWDEHFRTSDIPGERGAGFSRWADPPKGLRIGSICMDGSRRDERGRGACSGYGGVRYWIYQVGEDSTVFFPTENHWAHPEPLTEMEINNLSSRTTAEPLGKTPGRGRIGYGEVFLGMIICATIAYIAKLWFDHGQSVH